MSLSFYMRKQERAGSKLEIFTNEVWVGVPKIPAKICIFEEIREAIFQLSVEHSIFHLKFMSVVTALSLFKPCSSYYSRFGMSKVSLLNKSSKLILLMILSWPKLYRKLEFQFGLLKFLLNCLRKTHISLWIFESPLARHAGCYHPIFESAMLVFGGTPSILIVNLHKNSLSTLSLYNLHTNHSGN